MQKKATTKGELIFGIHPIVEVLKAKKRKLLSLYTTRPVPKAWHSIERLLPKRPIMIQYVSREVLHKLAGTIDHQGVVGYVQPLVVRKKFFEAKKEPFLLLLDGIQDIRNLGAILRSAYCAGVDGVIITQKDSAPLNAAAIKASAGLAEHLDIIIVPSARAAVPLLKKAGYQIYLTTFKGENAATCTYKEPLCVIIGNEAVGINKSILTLGTHITLPQRSSDISYNASVAAGIMLFLIATQLHKI